MSNQTKVTLKDELEMLEVYINLEAMLLNHDFNYSINIDPCIEPKSVFIPGLILQPFVENAFKHGLHHKSGLKQLEIQLTKVTNDILEVKIIDNGVGRKESAKIRSNHAKYESYALSSIEKRINLINKIEQVITVSIIDLQEDQMPTGTMVLLTFKI